MRLDDVVTAAGGTLVHTQDTIDQAVRSRTVGGSDIPIILGLSEWTTPVELHFQKRDGIRPERTPEDLARMRAGSLLEPVVRALYQERYPDAQLAGKAYVIGREPWIAANLDDFARYPDPRVVEFKTASEYAKSKWGDDGSDAVPLAYLAQVTWYGGIMKTSHADIAVLIGGNTFQVHRVRIDVDVFEFMVDRAREFMRGVEMGIPPEPLNEADVARLFPRSTGTTVEATPTVLDDVLALRALNEKADAIETEKELLRLRIKAAIGDADALTLANGDVLATWKTQTRKTLDTKALRAAHPDIAGQFTRASDSRVFLLK